MSTRGFCVLQNKSLYELCVGLEIHAQILSNSKLFSNSTCSSLQSFPNSCVSLFDAAYPGTLPSLNRIAIHRAITAALVLNCKINTISYFERKHYFYQDLPLGYQITQQQVPIAVDGHLIFDAIDKTDKESKKSLALIKRIQIEQDSGKSIHDIHPNLSAVDLNRAGVGLLEIVFAPTLRSASEAAAVVKKLQDLFRHIGICDGNMESGSFRIDVNVSMSKKQINQTENNNKPVLGQRVEIKNLNSIQKLVNAIQYESQRQMTLLEAGQRICLETRGYDSESNSTYHMRLKETSMDYRFFPDPDLPRLVVTEDEIRAIQESIPELPQDTMRRLNEQYGLEESQSLLMISHVGLLHYYESVMSSCKKKKKASEDRTNNNNNHNNINNNNNNNNNINDESSNDNNNNASEYTLHPAFVFNWITTELLGLLNTLNLNFQESPISPLQTKDILDNLINGVITAPQAKLLFKILFEEYPNNPNISPFNIILEKGWKRVTDVEDIKNLCLDVISDMKHAKQLKKFRDGKKSMENYFFGEVMKKSKNQACPHTVQKVLKVILEETK